MIMRMNTNMEFGYWKLSLQVEFNKQKESVSEN